MKDNTIDYNKIMNALNQSLEIMKNESNNEDVLQQLLNAQQDVQQAMNFSFSHTTSHL